MTLKFATTLTISMGILAISSCSGGGSNPPPEQTITQPPPPPVVTTVASVDFEAVERAIDAFQVNDVTVLIGDADGVLFTYERGRIGPDSQLRTASASKMAFGLLIWTLVESGDLSIDDRPQDHISFWARDDMGGRSDIVLGSLLGFTSGFNNPPDEPGCIGSSDFSLAECVQDIHDGDLDSLPSDGFYYGPEHMQIAALMATQSTGRTINQLLNDRLKTPIGLSADTFFLPIENTRYSGTFRSTPSDYGRLLQAILAGDLVDDREGYLSDRTADAFFGFRPSELGGAGRDWHYGFGFWKECDFSAYQAECDNNPVISSPGLFGFTPWIDFNNDYWGVIAIEEINPVGFSASAVSVDLEQEIQQLIENQLTE